MSSQKEKGIIMALLKRFETQRLPRTMQLKEKVDQGGTLSEHDQRFINEVMQDAKSIQPMLDKHPEYTELVTKAYNLYKEIMDKSLANEK